MVVLHTIISIEVSIVISMTMKHSTSIVLKTPYVIKTVLNTRAWCLESVLAQEINEK